MMNIDDSSTSGYLTDEYEGLSTSFADVEQLPSTGYCDLYRAKRFGRWYLLKCLRPDLQGDEAYRQMLRKELEILMRLQHPGVMQAVGMETVVLPVRGTTVCMVAEWIDGMTLADYLQTELSVHQLRRVALELAEAVAYVHQQQVVHRDLKPRNVMVTSNGGYVKLIDFGLADTDSHAILKQPAGTLRYIAPEQARLAQADVRNDIYSLGVMMQEMNDRQQSANPLKRVVPKRIVNRCLAPIDHRWQDMDALLEALRRSSQRRRRLMVAAAVALVAVIVGVMGWQMRHLQQKAALIEGDAAQMNRQLRVLRHEIIDFEDETVRHLCLARWDSDHDGELSYEEAAAVTELGQVFTGRPDIASFNELQHFTGLTDISRDAFRDCVSLRSLTLPRTIRFFRQDAFRHSGLHMLTVPSTVVGIGDYCMDDCPQLQTVVFEALMPQTNEGVTPLQGCPQLTAIYVPKYVLKRTDRQAWEPLQPLMQTNIVFADPEVKAVCVRHWDRSGDGELQIDEAQAVTSLDAAFTNNPVVERFDELRFFTGLEEIGISDFEYCAALRSIQLPSTIRRIRAYAFRLCVSLQAIDLPEFLERIDNDAFLACGLRSIYIPAATTSIATTAISACRHLTRVVVSPQNPVYDSRDNCNAIIDSRTNMMVSGSAVARIPRSVTSLSDEAFNFFDPTELTIPAQITRIGPWTFATRIGRVYLESSIPPAFDSQGGRILLIPPAYDDYPGPEIYVPIGSLPAYEKADGWRQLSDYIREYPAKPVAEPLRLFAFTIHEKVSEGVERKNRPNGSVPTVMRTSFWKEITNNEKE